MNIWPWIKTKAPETPYKYGPNALDNPGIGTGDRPFSTGQYMIPYAPYDHRHLVRGDLGPLRFGGMIAAANVRDVSLSGNGTYVVPSTHLTSLFEMENAAEPARGVLG